MRSFFFYHLPWQDSEFKNNRARGLNLIPAISQVSPPCALLWPSLSGCVFSGPRTPQPLFFHPSNSPLGPLPVLELKGDEYQSKVTKPKIAWHLFVLVFFQVMSPHLNLWPFELILCWVVCCRLLCYFCKVITAVFMHLLQETGQLRPEVSYQPTCVQVGNRNKLNRSLNLDRSMHIHIKKRKCSAAVEKRWCFGNIRYFWLWHSILGIISGIFTGYFLVVFDSTIQKCHTWRGRPWPGLTALLQVHGEAIKGRLAQEATEVFSQELAAALLCAEGKHTDLPQRWQRDHGAGETHVERYDFNHDVSFFLLTENECILSFTNQLV